MMKKDSTKPANKKIHKELDLNTFGSGLVNVILAEELNRLADPKHTRVVGKTLTLLRQNLNAIHPGADKKQKLLFYKLIKDYTFKSINESVILKDKTVINFLKNATTAILRRYAKENNLS